MEENSRNTILVLVNYDGENLGGNPNQMNIQSMYNDINLDASDLEVEFQAAMDELLYFVDLHLLNTGAGDFTQSEATITFNTNLPMDEAATIQNIQNSTVILSTETLIAHHPWVTNVNEEIDRLNKEKDVKAEQYGYSMFGQQGRGDNKADTDE